MVRILRRLNLAPAGMVACILLLCPLVHGAAAVTPAGKRIGWPPGFAHKVAIIGPTDDRVELSKVPGLKEIGFGRADFQQAMACTGTIICSRKVPNGIMTTWGSAASIMSANQIVTAAHVFFDPKTKQRNTSLQNCYFHNYSNRRVSIPILVTPAFEDQLRENDPRENHRRDWVVVRLASAIPNCTPYEADSSGDVLAPGAELLAISHLHKDIKNRFSGREPIGQRCKVRLTGVPFYLTDCDADAGASGSIGLVRRDGKWIPKAILIGTNPSAVNYAEFDLNKHQFTVYLGIERDFLRAIGIEPHAPSPIVPMAPASAQP
jgi:hypothetical protein